MIHGCIDTFVTFIYTLVTLRLRSGSLTMQTVIHIKADKEVKENAAKAARDLGLSLSDVINASLRNFIRTRKIVFSDTPQMTPELEKLLDKVEEDIKHNRNLIGPFKTPEEMDKLLDSLK